MKKVGIISDTHCIFPDIVKTFLADVDEIWHLGDIYSQGCFDSINNFREITHAVKGNWDNTEDLSLVDSFSFEGKKIFMIHKGLLWKDGKREFYNGVWEQIREDIPNIILYGHTHYFDYATMIDLIPLVNKRVLVINPGAVSPLFHERGSCVKLTFENSLLRDVSRLSYDCPTVRLKFNGVEEYGEQCLIPSLYKSDRDTSLPFFEQREILVERPLNVRVEKVFAEDWRDGAHLEFPRKLDAKTLNPWQMKIEVTPRSK